MTASVDLELPMFDAPSTEAAALWDAKRQIDAMSFAEMLHMVRTASLRHPLFRGEVGKYFHAVLKQKRLDTPPEERRAISQKIGF